jgi:Xaa-Pro aminopeptidase
LPAAALVVLREELPNARFIDATKLIRQDMARKTEREIRLIARSVEISEQGFQNVLRHMREALGQPVSELMYRYYMPEVNRLGGCLLGSNLTSTPWQWWDAGRKTAEEGMCAIGTDEARTGVNINTWAENGREPIVREGGIPINFDLLCYYHGMQSDIAFRAVVGEPDLAFVEIFEISVLAKDALVAAVKPGMTCAEAEEACLAGMRRAVGTAWDKNYWAVHSTGHTPHEFPEIGSPYLGQKGDWMFEAGNVLSIETIAEEAYVLRDDGLHRLGAMEMKIYSA